MNIGILIGFILMLLGCIINGFNLWSFEDPYTHESVKHWRITYYISWLIPFIPFAGVIIEVGWFIGYLAQDYKCVSPLFEEL